MKVIATDDQLLLERIAAGDRQALAGLYERHRGALYGYLSVFTRDHGLIEEITQDTMLAAWSGARRFAGRSTVRSWLFAIGRRRAADALRRKALPLTGDDGLAAMPDPDPGPERLVLANATNAELADAMDRLAPVHKEVLVLTFVYELSYQEIADVLGVPLGTIKSRLSNARKALRAHLRTETP